MSLKILYLLADPGISLTGSAKGASTHARSIINAMVEDFHDVTVLCMRMKEGERSGLTSECATLLSERGAFSKWFFKRFIQPCERGRAPLNKQVGSRLAREGIFLLCLLASALLGAFALRSGGGARFGCAFGAVCSLAAAFPIRLRLSKLARRRWTRAAGKEPVQPDGAVLALYNLLLQRDFYRAARRVVARSGKPDVIYARDAWFAFPYYRLARKLGVPLVLEVNAIAWKEKEINGEGALTTLCGKIERRNLETACMVLTVSQGVRAQAIEAGATSEKTVVTPNGVDVELFEDALASPRLARARGRFVVGLVCSVKPYHGVDLLVEAAEILKKSIPNLLVWILGSGPDLEKIEKMVHERGLRKTVRLEGIVPHHALPGYMAQFDVAVAPFRGERHAYMSPIKLFEYMASRRPIVCARWGELPTLLSEGEEALFHEPDSAQDLADQVLRLYEDKALAARLAEKAALRVRQNTWLEIVRRTFAEMEERGYLPPGARLADPADPGIVGRRDLLFQQRRERRSAWRSMSDGAQKALWAEHDGERDAFLSAAAERPPGAAGERSREGLPPKPGEPPERKPLKKSIATSAAGRMLFNVCACALTACASWLERRRSRSGVPRDRAIRVLRLVSSASVGGVAKVMNQTILRFDPCEVETQILVFGAEDHISPRLTGAPGLTFIHKPMELWLDTWDWKILGNIRRIAKQIRRGKADIIHLHEPQFAPAVRVAAALAGARFVVQLHSQYARRRKGAHAIHKRLERQALRAASLIGHSQNVIENAYEYMRVSAAAPRKPIFLAICGVDDAPLWAHEGHLHEWIQRQAGGKKVFLLIARLIRLKRIADYMAACRLLMDAGEDVFMALVVYGALKPQDRTLKDFYQTFKPGEAELLVSIASPADLLAHVHGAVSTSEIEGLPKSILEYMRHGVPVICSDIPAHRQLIEHEENGLLFPLGDVPELVRQMRRTLHDPVLCEKITRNARDSIAHRRWSETARQNLRIYRHILSS